jgi:membrane fusion protein (multidrug efflux system)
VARAASGLAVQLRLADDSIYSEKGKIDFLDVTADPRTDGQIARAVFENKNNTLTDGMTVRVVLEAEKAPTVVPSPKRRVALDQSGSYVFVVNDKNVASSGGSRPARHATDCWPSRRASRPAKR